MVRPSLFCSPPRKLSIPTVLFLRRSFCPRCCEKRTVESSLMQADELEGRFYLIFDGKRFGIRNALVISERSGESGKCSTSLLQ
jgi:hypothetical protein